MAGRTGVRGWSIGRMLGALLLVLLGAAPGRAQDIPATGDQAWAAAAERADQRIADFERIQRGGNPAEVRKAALALQQDPIAVARLNKNGSDTLKGNLNQILDGIKSNTKDAVRSRVAAKFRVPPSEVTFFEATNPSAVPKVGQDWDVTVRVRGKDVQVGDIRDIVHDAYYEAATGREAPPRPAKPATPPKPPKGVKLPPVPELPPHPADVFAHQQAVEVINSQGAEAYGGSKSEGSRIIEGPKDQRLRDPHQISDAIEVKSNLPREKALKLEGQAQQHLRDAFQAEQAGDFAKARESRLLAREKILDAQGQWLEQARQYDKQFSRQIKPRVEGVGGAVPDHVQRGSEILKAIADGEMSPAKGREALMAMGETPESIINKGAGLVESSQTVRAPGTKGRAPADVLPDNVKDRIELDRLRDGREPLDPAARGKGDKGGTGKPAPAKPGTGTAARIGAATTEVAGGVGGTLAAITLMVDYQACLDAGRDPTECKRDLTLAVGGVAVFAGVTTVTAQTLVALGISTAAVSAVGAAMAVVGVPLAIYGAFDAGERWANAPEIRANALLHLQQRELLMGFGRLVQKVQTEVDQLQGLRAQSQGLCQQSNGQVQAALSLDQQIRAQDGKLQGLLASIKRGASQCAEAGKVSEQIGALQRKSKDDEDRAIGDLDQANVLAKRCNGKAEADKIRELYEHSKQLANRLLADAAVARGRNNRLNALKAEVDPISGDLQTVQELRRAIGSSHGQLRDLSGALVASRDQLQGIEARFQSKRAFIQTRIDQLRTVLPNQTPSELYREEFVRAHYALAGLRQSFADAGVSTACAYAGSDPSQVVVMQLNAGNLYGAADAGFMQARELAQGCGSVPAQDRAVEAMEASANWAQSAVEMNDFLPKKAQACQTQAGAGAAPNQCPANAAPAWSDEKQKNVCRCVKGFKVSEDRKSCVPDTKNEPVVIACNTTTKAGTNPPQTVIVNVGRQAGTAHFQFEMYNVPDHMIVQYGGRTLADTGCVSGAGKLALPLSGAAEQVTIIVKPACRKSDETKWNFTLSCPSTDQPGTPGSTGAPGTLGVPTPPTLPPSAPGVITALQLEAVSGQASIVPRGAAPSQPLRPGGELRGGATLQTGTGAQVVIKSPGETRVTIGANSQVQVGGSDARTQVLELQHGSIDINHRQGTPNFDDVVIRTPEGTVQALGTRYRVHRDERGTEVQVFEGSVRLSGRHIIRTYAPNVERGKPSPVREMDLRAGEQALMANTVFGSATPSPVPPATPRPVAPATDPQPSWARPAAPNPPDDDRLPEAVAAVAAAAAAAASPLNRADPWNDARVQQWIDEWLRNAKPVVRADLPGPWRFSEWGQVLGPGSTAAGAPDHPAGWSRHQSLWAKRSQFDSLNLCTLGEYVQRRVAGRGAEGCAKAALQPSAPSWVRPATPPPVPAAPPPAPRRSDDVVVNPSDPQLFVGDWDCTLTNEAGKTAKSSHRIIRDSAGRYLMRLPGIDAQHVAKYVNGNRIGFVIGDGSTGRDVLLDFTVNHGVAVGTDRIHYYDGRRMNYSIRCNKQGASSGGKK